MAAASKALLERVRKYSGWYERFFCQRKEAFALQTDEGTYYAVRKPVTLRLIEAHLLGEVTAGWYALDRENTLRWAALDADGEDGLTQLQQVGLVLKGKGWPAYLEDSRKGGHLWIFFYFGETREERIGACPVRAALGHLLIELGLEEEIELFPKQEELGEGGLGSLMRGPLGVHRACGKRFGFLDLETLKPVGRTLMEELEYVTGFQTVTGAQVAEELGRILRKIPSHRGPAQPPRKGVTSQRGAIQELKEEIGDLYPFVSRFVELDGKGRGHCPFHPPDHRPSFAVNREENYWVDFHDQTGGDAIAFYQRLKGISFLEAVKGLARVYQRADLIQKLEWRKP